MQSGTLEEKYQQLADKNGILCNHHRKILLILSLLRLLVSAGGIGLAVACFSFSAAAGILSVVLSVIIFLFLLNRYAFHSERKEFFGNIEILNKNEINALKGDLSPFNSGEIWKNTDHDFSNDLDLFGQDSLFHFLNRTITGHGRNILAQWLSDPYKISGLIKSRQETIAELSLKTEWRRNLLLMVPVSYLKRKMLKDFFNGLMIIQDFFLLHY